MFHHYIVDGHLFEMYFASLVYEINYLSPGICTDGGIMAMRFLEDLQLLGLEESLLGIIGVLEI